MNVVLKGLSCVTNGDTIRLSNHSLFRLLATLNAHVALVEFRGAMLTTEIAVAAVARHEGHPHSTQSCQLSFPG